jgi:hypothetical protein
MESQVPDKYKPIEVTSQSKRDPIGRSPPQSMIQHSKEKSLYDHGDDRLNRFGREHDVFLIGQSNAPHTSHVLRYKLYEHLRM